MAASPRWLEAGGGQCRGRGPPSARYQTLIKNDLCKATNEIFGLVIPLRITTPALANDTSEDAIPLRITSPVVGRHDIIDEAPSQLAEHCPTRLPFKGLIMRRGLFVSFVENPCRESLQGALTKIGRGM
ncbi:unnamed protein product [Penicillium pancosmium]